MKRLIASMVGLLGLMASAAPVLSPQGIIVNPVPTDLDVQTWLDRDPSGLGNATYFFGDKIRIYTRVNQNAYVYLFNINADGQIDLILPNAFNQYNYLRAGETRVFPEPGARYDFTIGGPAGVDQVLAVASRTPLSLAQVADIKSGQMRVQGASNLARALSIVVTPLPDRDWVSDVVRYNVQPRWASNPEPPVLVAPRPPIFFITPIPGYGVLWEDREDTEYRVAYRGGDVEQIFSYYHRDLLSKGWVKVNFKSKGGKKNPAYEAEYRRGGDKLEVSVSPRGGEMVVKLEWGK
ncbi:DUF4384 domain-containing protein [Meiothermus sp.]|uniref:DUF4384 domain-containing protein n=1 Tax=Meiothermus sp. TaxID=1955249 RepID=UPI0021DE9951|nr:DUF4384 domain-containing protein [Meiothermus sp.]GIW33461.1 MAG: hypothetical protein KatS3mg072_0794 [Meiothermus sp.]